MGGLDNGFMEMVDGIHRSFHTEVDAPSPMCLIRLTLRASRPTTIALQVADADFGVVACIMSESEKYLPSITLVHRASGFVMNLQPCFPRSARLNSWISRKPIPPLTLGVASLSQAIQYRERLPKSPPTKIFHA